MTKKRALPVATLGGLTPSQALASSSHLRAHKAPAERPEKQRVLEVLGGRELDRGDEVDGLEGLAIGLSVEFPLLDLPLILALLSDLPPATSPDYPPQLSAVREMLGVIEAGMIPDDQEPVERGGVGGSFTESSVVESSEPGSVGLGHEGGQLEGRNKDGRGGKGKSKSSSNSAPSSTPSLPRLPSSTASSSSHLTLPSSKSSPTGLESLLPALEISRSRSQTEPVAVQRWEEERERERGRSEGWEGGSGFGEEKGGEERFLMEMFPTLTQEDILQALHHLSLTEEYTDLSTAIEDLLSVEAIRDAQERGGWDSGEGEGGTDEEGRRAVDEIRKENEREKERGRKRAEKEKQEKVKAWEGGVSRPLSLSTPLYHSKITHPQPSHPPRTIPVDLETLKAPGPVRAIRAEETTRSRAPRVTGSRYADLAASPGVSSGDESSVEGSPRLRKAKPVALVDTMQRGASPVSRRGSPAVALPGNGEGYDEDQNTRESLAGWLAETIGGVKATPAHFMAYFEGRSYVSGYEAMLASLQALMVPRAQVVEQIKALEEVMQMGGAGEGEEPWEREARADLGVCVRVAEGNGEVAMDLMEKLQDVKDWGREVAESKLRDKGKVGYLMRLPDSPLTEEFRIPPRDGEGMPSFPPSPQSPGFVDRVHNRRIRRQGEPEHPQNWKKVVKPKNKVKVYDHPYASSIPSYSRGATPHDPRRGALFSAPEVSDLDMKACLSRAEEVREKRKEAVRQAGRYFSGSGGARGKEVAAYYAGEARKLGEEAKGWEMKAARELVKSNSAGHDRFCIDVHHLTLSEASQVVREHVAVWHASQHHVPNPTKPFQVITGVGKHSVNHVGILLPALCNILEKEGWKVDRGYAGRGYLVVRGVRG